MNIFKKISSPANQPADGEFTVKLTAIATNGNRYIERFNTKPAELAELAAEFGEEMCAEHDVEITTVQISMSLEKLTDVIYA